MPTKSLKSSSEATVVNRTHSHAPGRTLWGVPALDLAQPFLNSVRMPPRGRRLVSGQLAGAGEEPDLEEASLMVQ